MICQKGAVASVMLKIFASKQFIYFLMVGVVAASANFGSRIIYSQWVEFSDAIILAYITGMIVAFTLDKIFVFEESQKNLLRSVLFFCLVNAVGLMQTWLLTMFLAYYALPFIGVLHYKNELAHAFGICAPVVTSFLGHKYFTFR
jgi:putative flippase GtrA